MAQESGWSVFWSSRVSKAGVVLLALQIAVSVYVLLSYPLDFGTRYWNNPAYWSDNPKEVAPEWVNLFSSKPSPRHILVSFENVGESAEKAISYVYEDFPSFVSVSVSDVKYSQRPPVVLFELQRPDGSVVMFYTLS
ncbi:MAG: hypothetical protein NZ919_03870, partial [Candidatus Caldarchaeum sp.]|nr:hypothetical protein [Candidatus Caldarchaeum sp.]